MAFQGSDRRMRARYKVRVPFTLKSNGQEIRGMTRNVSLLGISAYSDSPISQVQPVQCLLSIPTQQQPLVAHGTVIRCEPMSQPHPDGSHEIGVFFKQFETGAEVTLERFLESLLKAERSAIQAGYRALKQRAAERQKRKKQEAAEKSRRRRLRLARRKRRLAKQKKLAGLKRKKRALKARSKRSKGRK